MGGVVTEHIGKIGGIEDYIAEFTSDEAWGDEGYLTDKGMIPMPQAERDQFSAAVKGQTALSSL